MTYLPTIIAAVMALVTVFTPQLQDYISAHPAVAAVIAAAGAIAAHLAPSPRGK